LREKTEMLDDVIRMDHQHTTQQALGEVKFGLSQKAKTKA